jgi:hypothetical protein
MLSRFVNINIFHFIQFLIFIFSSLPAPSTSPFFAGGPTRATASTFQPFNPRYRSPNTRAAAAANLNDRRSVTPSVTPNRNPPTANERPSRRIGNLN